MPSIAPRLHDVHMAENVEELASLLFVQKDNAGWLYAGPQLSPAWATPSNSHAVKTDTNPATRANPVDEQC